MLLFELFELFYLCSVYVNKTNKLMLSYNIDMKLIDFIKEKINNFEEFINEQIKKCNFPENTIKEILNNIETYKDDIPSFVSVFKTINRAPDLNKQIDLFFSIYQINILDYPDFDLKRLKAYVSMFCDLCDQIN
jgi:hypothetical protein